MDTPISDDVWLCTALRSTHIVKNHIDMKVHIYAFIIIIIIIYQAFLPIPRRGAHTQSTYTPKPIYLTSALYFSVVAPFLQFIPTASSNGIPSSPGDNRQSTGGQSERTQGQAKMAVGNSTSYMCTRALHSLQSFAH